MIIGAQLFTVRDFMQTPEDVRETFRRIAAIGYPCVQVSGTNASAEVIRDAAAETGLQVVLTHTNADRILHETKAVIAEHRLFGCDRVGIGYMPDRYARSREGFLSFLADYLPAAKTLKEEGMTLHYHNHAFEFERFGEDTGFDILVKESDPELLEFTLDTYWVQVGGKNPVEVISQLPGRVTAVHYKDLAIVGGQVHMAAVGNGNLDFRQITDACLAAGTQWALVEQDEAYGKDPFDELAISYRYATALLK